jgi:hypothetical protein
MWKNKYFLGGGGEWRTVGKARNLATRETDYKKGRKFEGAKKVKL